MNEKNSSIEHEGEDVSDSFSAYQEYNKILRTWFVAFGIGGPSIFLVNDKVAIRLATDGELKFVATLFLLGAASQIFGAFINKIANWYEYRSNWGDPETTQRRYKISHWLIEQFWIDIAIDLITFVCFGIAAWKLLTAFSN